MVSVNVACPDLPPEAGHADVYGRTFSPVRSASLRAKSTNTPLVQRSLHEPVDGVSGFAVPGCRTLILQASCPGVFFFIFFYFPGCEVSRRARCCTSGGEPSVGLGGSRAVNRPPRALHSGAQPFGYPNAGREWVERRHQTRRAEETPAASADDLVRVHESGQARPTVGRSQPSRRTTHASPPSTRSGKKLFRHPLNSRHRRGALFRRGFSTGASVVA